MSHPKISAIIPVYNTSKYLEKCVESVINQTLSNIEIILVNDCSPDDLDHSICSKYQEIDHRVIYIKHETNLGLGGARNSGLKEARGDYIWFIDSDDFIDINACEFLYSLAISKDLDIVAFSATSHINGNINISDKKYYYYSRDISILDQTFSGKNFIDAASLAQSFHVSACLHLFKRELISNFKFRENVVHEDTDLIPIVIYNASSVYCVKYAPYYRLLREGSLTQTEMSIKILTDKLLCVESLLQYAIDSGLLFNDPLLNYIHNEFNNTKNIYTVFDKKTKYIESLFYSINKAFVEIPKNNIKLKQDKYGGYKSKYLDSKIEIDNLKKIISHLNRELNTIKSSRFWKFTENIRKIKSLFIR